MRILCAGSRTAVAAVLAALSALEFLKPATTMSIRATASNEKNNDQLRFTLFR